MYCSFMSSVLSTEPQCAPSPRRRKPPIRCGMPDDSNRYLKLVGANVRRFREAADLTREQLAELAGYHENTIQNIENGKTKTTTLKTLNAIAVGVAVPFEALLAAPGGSAAGAEIAERFAQGQYAHLVTAEDLEWLRNVDIHTWLGESPSDELIYQALRLRKQATLEAALDAMKPR